MRDNRVSGAAIFGIGNRYRGDDGVGPAVARAIEAKNDSSLRVREMEGEGTAIMEKWKNEEFAIVVDASSSGVNPGAIRRFDAVDGALPLVFSRSSTHAFGVAEAVELSRALGELPRRLVIFAVEGKSFSAGEGLSSEVAEAIPKVVCLIEEELRKPK